MRARIAGSRALPGGHQGDQPAHRCTDQYRGLRHLTASQLECRPLAHRCCNLNRTPSRCRHGRAGRALRRSIRARPARVRLGPTNDAFGRLHAAISPARRSRVAAHVARQSHAGESRERLPSQAAPYRAHGWSARLRAAAIGVGYRFPAGPSYDVLARHDSLISHTLFTIMRPGTSSQTRGAQCPCLWKGGTSQPRAETGHRGYRTARRPQAALARNSQLPHSRR